MMSIGTTKLRPLSDEHECVSYLMCIISPHIPAYPPQSEADKIRIVKAAEADAEAKYLAGQGIARQRQAIISGLRESVQAFQSEVSDGEKQGGGAAPVPGPGACCSRGLPASDACCQ